ncbi:uncharacterized protein LOC132748234 [Ruditapes philippinarum]|uniref:uncharacterized protein LOC132748234 n=1 Tax=Ruditapes philippinarum TaxID=129788 RepID=UPI00295B4B4E|nr:uncharacterized protein LOC132748234 [Ruditapes philippinarum]
MDTDMDDDYQAADIEHEGMNVGIEPRITNRAQGGVRTDKTRFIRPVERQRMRPWLIDHLDQNDIPGLVWQERTEMIFRISWKHAANQCFNMQKDTNLFERWAIHTGRHQDSDHKRWKANFRCALNSLPDVTEMKEQGVKKGNNAFKVYRFLDEKEAKLSKDGKPRKKKEPLEYKDDSQLVKFKEGFVMSYDSGEGTSYEGSGASGSSIPNLHQLVPSGVDMLLEADSKDNVQPIVGGMDNLQEILAAATASLAAGGDAVALEKISIEQLSRLGEVSKMKLDIRQSDRKRRKKEVSGILNVFLCNWCEKVFPTKVDLFQHFLIIHQDKLLSGEEYGARKHTQPTEKLQQEIEDLEKKVLGFTQDSYQNESEEVIEDGQVVDLSSNNSMTSSEVYIEDQVLDLSVAGALAKHPQSQIPEVALDLSMSTSKQKTGQKSTVSKMVQKRRRSNATDGDYSNKFGNYGLAGEPRTKRQLSLLLKRKEEEEEKARKHAEAQHSMEDLVHAEILISLKSGSKDENETESMELENGDEKDGKEDKKSLTSEIEQTEGGLKEMGEQDGIKTEAVEEEEKLDDETEEVEEEVISMENVFYMELNDGSKVAISKQVEIPLSDPEKSDEDEAKNKNGVTVLHESVDKSEDHIVKQSEQDNSSGKPYKCALCPQRFEDPKELLTHVSVHKTEYKCSVCMNVMTDKDVYLSHIESHLPAGKHGHICDVCNVHFSTVEELQKHNKSHESGTKLYKCGNCGKNYQTVKECVNCEICLQAKGKVKEVASKGSKLELKVVLNDISKTKPVVTKVGKSVNEKGAAEAGDVAKSISDIERQDDLKEKIHNTGQKNLKGEPVITPVAGSENLTGIISTVIADKNNVYLDKQDTSSRKCLSQESFELPMDCLEDNCEEVRPKDVKNDVVDGENSEKMLENMKTEVQVFPKENKIVEEIDKNVLKPVSLAEKVTKTSSDVINFTEIKEVKKEKLKVAENDFVETSTTEEKLAKGMLQKEQKCSQCQETFKCEEDMIKHMQSHKETIEDKIGKNIFHCGICDLKLNINDVESHLQTHKASKPGKPCCEEIDDDKCTCVICKETLPANRLDTHLKSHSVYDLSKSQNVMLTQRLVSTRVGMGKGKMPFICNLCSYKFATFADLKLHVKTHLGPRICVEDSKTEIKNEKTDSIKKEVVNKKARGKKRKDTDEKRITGKRPKGRRYKLSSKVLKVKGKQDVKVKNEDQKDIKVKASPTITAALKSGPKYSLSTLTEGQDAKHIKHSSQARQKGDSSIAQIVQLEKGSVVVLNNGEMVVREEDKDKQKDLKRKNKVQLETVSTKKHKSTNENLSELNDSYGKKLVNKPDDDGKKESSVESFGVNNQSKNIQQQQFVKTEPTGSVNVISPASSAELIDKSKAGMNAKAATLYRLQQKILLVKEGGVKVATPVLSPLTVTVVSSHSDLVTQSRPLTRQAISGVTKPTVLAINKSSMIPCASAGKTQTIKGLVKNQSIPTPSVHVGNESHKQEPNVQSALSQTPLSLSTKSLNNTVVSTASPQAYILSLSSAIPVSTVSPIPVAFPQTTGINLPVSALASRVLKMHTTGASTAAVSSSVSLSSTSLPVSLVGSLQNQSLILTRVTPGVPVMACNSKQTMTGVTSINTAPSNILTSMTLQQQQQQQLNMLKTVIGRVNQPSIVNKPAISPVLITQGGLQQSAPSSAKFPFSNIIYAPQTSSEIQTVDTAKAVSTTKPQSYQLMWLPVGQQAPPVQMKPSASVTEAAPKRQFEQSLCLENTVLGAKLRAKSSPAFNQTRASHCSTTQQSGKVFSPPSVTPTSCSATFSSKEKSPLALQVSSNSTLQSPDDVKVLSNKSAIQILAGMSESGLCLACAICKQSLSNIEQISTHICKLSFENTSLKKVMPPSKEKKLETVTESTEAGTTLESKAVNSISVLKEGKVTTPLSQLPVKLSTLPSTTVSETPVSTTTTTTNLPTQKSAVTTFVENVPKPCIDAANESFIKSKSLASSTEAVDLVKAVAKDSELESEIEVNMPSEDDLNVCGKDEDEIDAEGNLPEVDIQKGSYFSQTLTGKTTPKVEQVITLYPCVICKKTFTLENFRKHAKKHIMDSSMAEVTYQDDNLPLMAGEENCPPGELAMRRISKPTESSRKSDIYMCCFCFITYDHETTLSQHYTTAHPTMTDYLCPADNCAQIFFDVQGCDKHYALKHQHECRFCLQRYRTYVEFQAHIVQHYKNRTLTYFSCLKCRTRFANKTAFYRHCRSALSSGCPISYLEKRINCQQCQCCSINFTSNECLKLHFKRKFYQGVTFRCCVCREAICTIEDIVNHMSNHFPISDDKQVCFCHICCVIFPYKSVHSHHLSSSDHIRAETLHQRLLDKYNHVVKNDDNVKLPDSIEKETDNVLQNERISEDGKVESETILTDNCGNHKGGKVSESSVFSCKLCDVCFKTSFDLKQHEVISHASTRPVIKRFIYNSGGTYIQNYRKRSARKSIVCEFCGKRFFHINDLRSHINISHNDELLLACKNPDCIMKFNSIYEYDVHVCKSLSKGKDIADVSCSMVDAGQPSVKSMKEYMLQYYVEDCKELLDTVATTVESVQEHLGDHFSCQYCDKRFHSCEQLKFHLINQHTEILAQCVDCMEYFFHQSTLLEHRRECAVKGFSDEDFHTKKKLLGCHVCFNSFLYILGLSKYLRDLKFLSEKYKSSGSKCFSRKGVFDLKHEGECGIEENSTVPFNNSRKFVCISCKNEYCNAEDFFICMQSRLTTERNREIEEEANKAGSNNESLRYTVVEGDDGSVSLFGKSQIDLKNVFSCNECESIVCYQDGGICSASLNHPCTGNNTLINEKSIC